MSKTKNMKKNSTYILAEMAASHEGNEKTAEFIIKTAANAGADGILFQIFDLDTYIVPSDENYQGIRSFYLKQKIWAKLIKKANLLGLDVWANVYDLKSAKLCKDKKIRGLKLHSSNLENEDLIKEMVKMRKELLLSIGGMEKKEIRKILRLIYSIDRRARICLMYGLQNFPTPPKGINLNFIRKLSKDFKVPFGYQDHSEPTSFASTYLPILFIAKGASVIEKHLTHNRSLKGLDYEAALNPDEFADFVSDIRVIDKILNKKSEEVSWGELKYRNYKTDMKLVAKKNIKAGDKFTKENLVVMRAKEGEVNGRYFKDLLNKKSKFNYKKFEPIKRDEFFKVGIFITARLKSTRFPKKVIKPILGKPMVEWMIDKLKQANIDLIVMMTSTNPQDDPLVEIAKKNKIEYFRGSEEDVLVRLRDCARKFKVDLVINATADNPFTESIFIKKLVEKYFDNKFDYCKIEGLVSGCPSEAISRSGLERACELKDETDTEFWDRYFTDTGKFKCDTIKVQDPEILHPEYRITVDTKEDFELATKIISALSKEKKYFDVYDICRLLKEKPELLKINENIEQIKPPKPKIKSRNSEFLK